MSAPCDNVLTFFGLVWSWSSPVIPPFTSITSHAKGPHGISRSKLQGVVHVEEGEVLVRAWLTRQSGKNQATVSCDDLFHASLMDYHNIDYRYSMIPYIEYDIPILVINISTMSSYA